MSAITLVDDLGRWASSRRAQEQLPPVVRRLSHATTTTATHIGLPAGDAVQQGGYDGVVVLNEAHHWPRTAAFLRNFAATYERDAAREDAEAELRHDLDD